MNINYEDIITAANARKEGLKAVETQLTYLENIAIELEGALKYFVELRRLVESLDDEGKKMLGDAHAHALYAGAHCAGSLNLFAPGGGGHIVNLLSVVAK